jgi:hypothetical protein
MMCEIISSIDYVFLVYLHVTCLFVWFDCSLIQMKVMTARKKKRQRVGKKNGQVITSRCQLLLFGKLKTD